MAEKQHFDEEVAQAVAAFFFSDLKLLVEWRLTEGGRPAFSTPKSDEDQWADFRDPVKRAATVASIERRQRLGLAKAGEVERYLKDMAALDAKMIERGLRGLSATA